MNVVRHHHPALEVVFLSFELPQGIGDYPRNFATAQITSTGALIQITLDLTAKISVGCRGSLRRQTAQSFCMLPLKLQEHAHGKRIGEPEGNEIRCTFAFDVRQVATGMNSTAQPVLRLIRDSGRPQSVIHALQAWIWSAGVHPESV
jgi:hypothetical protein